jgi:ribosomal protein L37AE/L43A
MDRGPDHLLYRVVRPTLSPVMSRPASRRDEPASPKCPRCGSSAHVRRGVSGLHPSVWSCRRCRLRIGLLDLDVQIARLRAELERLRRKAS